MNDEPKIVIRFLRYRELRRLVEQVVPLGLCWEWPPWRS